MYRAFGALITLIFAMVSMVTSGPKDVTNKWLTNKAQEATDRKLEEEKKEKLKKIQSFIVETVAKQLSVESNIIDPETPLYEYGLKSIDAVALVGGKFLRKFSKYSYSRFQ